MYDQCSCVTEVAFEIHAYPLPQPMECLLALLVTLWQIILPLSTDLGLSSSTKLPSSTVLP